MGFPEITEDQRKMAVVLLANALRKDAHLRARRQRAPDEGSPQHAALARRRAEPSQRYVDGMRDLLRVLFVDGHDAAEACLEEARALAANPAPHRPRGSNGRLDHE
jgi:hypothetical protein